MIRYNRLRTLTPFRENPCKSTSRNGKQTSLLLRKERGKLSHTIWGIPFPPTLPPKIPQIGTQNTVIYDNEPLPRTQKTPENAHSMGFSGVRKSILLRSLLIHLFCELLAEALDLCWFERYPHLSLPDLWLVKGFCL